MTDKKEQRICLKVCFKLGKTASETHTMLKRAFGDNILGQTQTYERFKRFKNGRRSVDAEERSGRPSTRTATENVAKMREVLLEERRATVHNFCNIILLRFEATDGKHPAQTSRQVAQQLLGPASIMTALRRTRRSLCGSFWLLRI